MSVHDISGDRGPEVEGEVGCNEDEWVGVGGQRGSMHMCVGVSGGVCTCVCASAWAGACAHVCVCVCVCARACAGARGRVCVCVCVCVHM